MVDILEKEGKKVTLLGNEAIARGAIEAGVGVVACYPGTPSSEVPVALASIAKKVGFYFEYSANEKVAFETGAGAAWSNVRALTAMKHFGLNVASDSILPVAYNGVRGGYIVMIADDPEGWSSAQSEQDTRHFARMAKIPTIEPTNPQECLDLTKKAFEISEEFQIPIFLRTTTKVSHSIGTIKLGKIKKINKKGFFKKNPEIYNNIRPNLQNLHRKIDEKVTKVEKKYGFKLNKVFPGKGDIGIIASGVSIEYAKELLSELNLNPPIAKIGLTYPLSKDFIAKFIKNKKTILVLEELEPIIENFVIQVAKEVNPKLKIHGKDLLPQDGEYNIERISPAVEKIFKKKLKINFQAHKKEVNKVLSKLTPRKPVFCPGCPHRSTFYAVKKVFGQNPVYAGDIGCCVLGIFEPFDMQDFLVSMGASIGLSHGITRVSDQEVILFVGDSNFFHACMPGLANLKYNDDKTPLIIVLDNSVTAMTGHQPHPGTGFTAVGDKVEPIKIEEVAKSLGANVKIVSSFNQKALIEALKEFKKTKGLRVIISKGECRLVTKRKFRKKGIKLPTFKIDQEKCKKCGICTDKFACPAIMEIRKKAGGKAEYVINPDLCTGCSVCMQVCPYGAISPV